MRTDDPIVAEKLYRWLAGCATAGEPAPPNAAIGDRFSFSIHSAERAISELERRGLIRVFRPSRRERQIEIVATGCRTYLPARLPSRVAPPRDSARAVAGG